MIALMESRSERYIMCVDCMDVAWLAGEDEIMEKFIGFSSGLVVSTEMEGITGVRKTKEKLHRMCIAAGGYHPQLNIGAWIGEREYALHCFREAERIYRPQPEDSYNYDVLPQWLMQMKAKTGVGAIEIEGGDTGPEFELDWKCVLFQSMNKADLEWDDTSKRMRNSITGTMPVLLHYNGDKTYGAHREMVRRILA